MGSADTLADFLKFCSSHYPAAHKMVIFWNHGGGSVGGAAFDENYHYDSLTLDEFYAAFDRVYDLSVENPPLDLIGFDTCLMATIDAAYAFSDLARYLVASEESEPGTGWYYTGWLETLADNPQMDGAALGTAICDSFLAGCQAEGVADEATLSVTDLGLLGPLLDAYDALGQEALLCAMDDAVFLPSLGRAAERAENYGGNTPDTGYTNMVDLGDLVRQSANLLPKNAGAVLDALDQCVLYKVNGPYRTQATGLSCYYTYLADEKDFKGYTEVGASSAFQYLYEYGLHGTLGAEGTKYVNSLGFAEEVPQLQTLET